MYHALLQLRKGNTWRTYKQKAGSMPVYATVDIWCVSYHCPTSREDQRLTITKTAAGFVGVGTAIQCFVV